MRIWCEGALREAGDVGVSVFDHGLTTGDGVFETVKTVDGRPFALSRHLARLAASARGLGLPEPDLETVRRACLAVAEDTPLPLGRLRVTYTAGRAPLGSERGDGPPTLVVAQSEVARPPAATAAVTVPWRRNEHSAVAGLKTTSYAENVRALARARQQGATEAILGNTAGRLCEGTGSNVFVVVDGELHTPPLSAGCLAGVTRALVLEWVGGRETDLPLDVLTEADEVFLTSTLRDVQPLHRIDGRPLPGAAGEVAAEAARVFARRAAATPDP